ncbi:MAG: helix-turn-helix transcriptional regulator [Deltaproteobacteria bacterium]|nr:helix-turn-helix transcriptional regulator [Deltaproteobacteria bacterium]
MEGKLTNEQKLAQRKRIAQRVAERIRGELDRQMMIQAELARRTGLPSMTISNVVKGSSLPELDTLLRIARVLGRSLDFLCWENGESSEGCPNGHIPYDITEFFLYTWAKLSPEKKEAVRIMLRSLN